MMRSLLSDLAAQLRVDEGVRSKPYRDTEGYLTIGCGHNLDAEGLCHDAIEAQLQFDIRTKAVEPLDKFIPAWKTYPESVQLALGNLMFNMGPKTLLGFHQTLSLIEKGHYREAAAQLLRTKYAKQVGQRAIRVAALLSSAQSSAPQVVPDRPASS